jgi:hypothetical protein
MMELDLGLEYRRVGEAHALGLEDLGRIALEGIDSTWLDASDRRSLTTEFRAMLQAEPGGSFDRAGQLCHRAATASLLA